jgi:tetratricopeptide (TPR) repeat protein
MPGEETLLTFNEAAAVGVAEARDHYRADRYIDAIVAAEKTLGRVTDPNSNLALLMRGELEEKISFAHFDSERVMKTIVVPSRSMAVEALCWSMRAHVALIEAHDEGANWIARLGELGKRIGASKLDDYDVLILLAQAQMFSGEYAASLEVGNALLRADPLDVAAGWVTFQTTRRSGDLAAAAALAHRLTERYLVQEGPTHYRWAVKLAYCIDDWSEVIRLGPEALRRMPDDYEMLSMLTSALLMSKRHEEARRYYERMRAVAPDAPFTMQLASTFAVA